MISNIYVLDDFNCYLGSFINNESQSLGLEKDSENFNLETVKYMQKSFKDNRRLFKGLIKKINNNYWITVILYIFSFAFGLILLSIPIAAAYLGGISTLNSAIAGLAGIADLVVVLLFRPVERIHELMADFSQITVITSSYQEQVGLRLLELDVRDRKTLDKAAVEINGAATNTVQLIQQYCEAKSEPEKKNLIEELIAKIQEYFKKKETK